MPIRSAAFTIAGASGLGSFAGATQTSPPFPRRLSSAAPASPRSGGRCRARARRTISGPSPPAAQPSKSFLWPRAQTMALMLLPPPSALPIGIAMERPFRAWAGLGHVAPVTLASDVHVPLQRSKDAGTVIRTARFEQQDLLAGVLRQAARHHATARAGAADDVVVGALEVFGELALVLLDGGGILRDRVRAASALMPEAIASCTNLRRIDLAPPQARFSRRSMVRPFSSFSVRTSMRPLCAGRPIGHRLRANVLSFKYLNSERPKLRRRDVQASIRFAQDYPECARIWPLAPRQSVRGC